MKRASFMFMSVLLVLAAPALAQDKPPDMETHSLMEFVKAGGVIGFIIMLLSVAAVALVIDTWLRLRRDRLLPPNLVNHSLELAEAGRLSELIAINKSSDSMFGRIVGGALDRARHGVDAVRQEMQQIGE